MSTSNDYRWLLTPPPPAWRDFTVSAVPGWSLQDQSGSLDHLDCLSFAQENLLEAIDWRRVHDAVQAGLRPLVERVTKLVPGAKVRSAGSQSRAFPLFSYTSLGAPGTDDREAVVVGLLYRIRDEMVILEGDICGEESGTIYDESTEEVFAAGGTEALEIASRSVADRLAGRTELVLLAMGATGGGSGASPVDSKWS
jgi:hypothetical protein